MGYHAINEGSNITVYNHSTCGTDAMYGEAIIGTLYNGECFTFVGNTGYVGNYEIRFLNKSKQYDSGFIRGGQYGNLAYSGTKVSINSLGGSCYRFKLRTTLTVVNTSGSYHTLLHAGDYVFTRDATAGASNKSNMHIIGYQKISTPIVAYNGFLTLSYSTGSMFNKNFCIYSA